MPEPIIALPVSLDAGRTPARVDSMNLVISDGRNNVVALVPADPGEDSEAKAIATRIVNALNAIEHIQAILIDENDQWITDLSGADVIEALTQALAMHGLGAANGDDTEDLGQPDGDLPNMSPLGGGNR